MANGQRKQSRNNKTLTNCLTGIAKSNNQEFVEQPKHSYVLESNYATSGKNEDSRLLRKIPVKSSMPKSRNAWLRNSDPISLT